MQRTTTSHAVRDDSSSIGALGITPPAIVICPRRVGTSSRRQNLARLRVAYFAKAGESAVRYGVRFERVVQHLWEARQTHRRLRLRHVLCISDVVQAAACVDGHDRAWADLAERFERSLLRQCRSIHGCGHTESLVLVRRLLAEVRRATESTITASPLSLRTYPGARPLRFWLIDHLRLMVKQRTMRQLCLAS